MDKPPLFRQVLSNGWTLFREQGGAEMDKPPLFTQVLSNRWTLFRELSRKTRHKTGRPYLLTGHLSSPPQTFHSKRSRIELTDF